MESKQMMEVIKSNLKQEVNVDTSEQLEVTSKMLNQGLTKGHSTTQFIKKSNQ